METNLLGRTVKMKEEGCIPKGHQSHYGTIEAVRWLSASAGPNPMPMYTISLGWDLHEYSADAFYLCRQPTADTLNLHRCLLAASDDLVRAVNAFMGSGGRLKGARKKSWETLSVARNEYLYVVHKVQRSPDY